MCILFAPALFDLLLFQFRFIMIKKISFLLSSNERIASAPFFDLHQTTQSCIVLASSSHLSFSSPPFLIFASSNLVEISFFPGLR